MKCMRKLLNRLIVFLFLIMATNNTAVYAQDKQYFNGIVAFDLDDITFKEFVKNPNSRFVEENYTTKYKYSKCEKNSKKSVDYEIIHRYNKSNEILEDKVYKLGNEWNGSLKFGFWLPIYCDFIDFINSEENIKNLVSNDKIYIEDVFLYNVERSLYVGIYVDAYPVDYFIEISPKGFLTQYSSDLNYKVYTSEEYKGKVCDLDLN